LTPAQNYDVIVVDTAPPGTRCGVEMRRGPPREWMQALLRVLLKYRALVGRAGCPRSCGRVEGIAS